MATEIAFAKQFLAQLDTKPSKIGPDHIEDPRNYPSGNPFLIPRYPSSPPLPKRRAGAPGSKPTSGAGGASSTTATTTTGTTSTESTTNNNNNNTITVQAVSARNPPLSLTFAGLEPNTTSLLDVKQLIHDQTGIPLAKVKLLYGKKPVPDTKVLKELLLLSSSVGGGDGNKNELELSVMVLGGAASVPPPPKKPEPVVEQQQEQGQKEADGGDKMQIDDDEGEKKGGVGETAAAAAAAAPVVAPGEISGKQVLATDQFWTDLRGFLEQRVKDVDVAREVVERWKGLEY